MRNRKAIVSIHDVTPVMEDRSKRIVDLVMKTTGPDLTLLVIPDFNSQGKLTGFPSFCSWLRSMKDSGVEIAQHGLTHAGRVDERSFGGKYLTSGEGEYASAGISDAHGSILAGFRILCDALGSPPSGFTAPAWLYSRGTAEALQGFDFQWVEYRSMIRYNADDTLRAPVIVYAAGTAWKRLCSRIWSRLAHAVLGGFSTIRFAAHVRDLPELQTSLERSLKAVCSGRRTVTTGGSAVK